MAPGDKDEKKDQATLENISTNIATMCSTLTSIDKNETVQTNTLLMMRNDYNKIIYALIAVIAASLGLKFINTPWYVDVAVFLCELTGVFVFFHLISVWKYLNLANRVMRIVLIVVMLFSSIVQTCVYHPVEEPAPSWFLLVVNVLLILLAVSSLWAVWFHKPKKQAVEQSKGECKDASTTGKTSP